MKKKSLLKIFFLFFFGFLCLTGCSFDEVWTYDLPNDYVIRHMSETEVILGKNIDGITETEYDGKTIGVVDYIAEFCFGKNIVALKCIEPIENGVNVIFYIVDTKLGDVYGPYQDEETYEAVKEKIVEENLGDWIGVEPAPPSAKYE